MTDSETDIFLKETILANILTKKKYIEMHSDTFKYIIPYILSGNMVVTTTKTKLSTSSCRLWQLLYIILYELFLINSKDMISLVKQTYQLPVDISQVKMMSQVKLIIDVIINKSQVNRDLNILSNIIFLNNNFNTSGNDGIFVNINNLDELPSELDKNGIRNYCFCLNFQDIDKDTNGIGRIIHFFTILKIKDQWIINSSYGSDYVKVPQYSQVLDTQEFQIFINFLNTGDSGVSEGVFTDLFIKYFLFNQVVWYKDKIDAEDVCEPWYNCAKMLIDISGSNQEIRYILDNRYLPNLRISWIKPYSNIIKSLVKTYDL